MSPQPATCSSRDPAMCTGPRWPCYKFGAKMGVAYTVKMMVQGGMSGFYLRVIQEGMLPVGAGAT